MTHRRFGIAATLLAVLVALNGGAMQGDLARATSQPAGANGVMNYRQGTVLTWNPVTLENTIDVDGVTLTNVNVLGVAEAASLSTGAKVGLAVVGSSWVILGRFVTPNTADATEAITLVGSRAHTATVATQEATSSATFLDLTTPGPSVSDVVIPASGKVEVTISAQISASSGVPTTAGFVGVAVSGSATVAPSVQQSLAIIGAGVALGGSRTVLIEGLPAGGVCTFKLQYRADGVNSQDFFNRNIVVKAL